MRKLLFTLLACVALCTSCDYFTSSSDDPPTTDATSITTDGGGMEVRGGETPQDPSPCDWRTAVEAIAGTQSCADVESIYVPCVREHGWTERDRKDFLGIAQLHVDSMGFGPCEWP